MKRLPHLFQTWRTDHPWLTFLAIISIGSGKAVTHDWPPHLQSEQVIVQLFSQYMSVLEAWLAPNPKAVTWLATSSSKHLILQSTTSERSGSIARNTNVFMVPWTPSEPVGRPVHSCMSSFLAISKGSGKALTQQLCPPKYLIDLIFQQSKEYEHSGSLT